MELAATTREEEVANLTREDLEQAYLESEAINVALEGAILDQHEIIAELHAKLERQS